MADAKSKLANRIAVHGCDPFSLQVTDGKKEKCPIADADAVAGPQRRGLSQTPVVEKGSVAGGGVVQVACAVGMHQDDAVPPRDVLFTEKDIAFEESSDGIDADLERIDQLAIDEHKIAFGGQATCACGRRSHTV